MLTSLSIRNVVLIDKLDLTFDTGLAVFTGETGAGKSILLDSLALVLGARADTGLIRHGQTQLSVTAAFSLPETHRVFQQLSEQGIDLSDDGILLRRIVGKDGKSKAFINDMPVSLSFLKNIGEQLVEIHGQFAAHSLLNPSTHLSVLDSYGHLQSSTNACKKAFEAYKEALNARMNAQIKLNKAAEEKAFLTESIQDLEKLNPRIGEEAILSEKRNLLMNSEKIISCTDTAYQLLTDEQKGAAHQLTVMGRQLEKADQYAQGAFQEILNNIYQAQELLADVSGQLENMSEKWGDISELSIIDDRLFALKSMARKHQTDINSLPTLLEEMKGTLNHLEHSEETINSLLKKEEEAQKHYLKQAHLLSEERKKTALKLDRQIATELPDLKLEKALFKTQIEQKDEQNGDENGLDCISFLISTNKGVPPAPLNKIASGGELSRFMLALKVNLAQADATPTLIFDEADSGIGGATADAVGARLNRLAQECQVLAVTHSPQVAAHGIHHWTVSKNEQKDCIITHVKKLSESERLQEIARMLSGSQITQTAETMARELLEKSKKQ